MLLFEELNSVLSSKFTFWSHWKIGLSESIPSTHLHLEIIDLLEHPPDGAVSPADEQPERGQAAEHPEAVVGAVLGEVEHLGGVEDLLEPPEEPVAVAVARLGVDEDDEGGAGEGASQVPREGGVV